MRLFKTTSKTQPSSHEGHAEHHPPPDAASPTKSSPTKSSSRPSGPSNRKSTSTSSSPQASPARREHRSKSSRTYVRHSTDPGHSSRRSKVDLNTHPLNLPPEERKRLSALSNMSDPSAMDVDPPSSPSSSSTNPQQAHPQPQSAFSVPITNGTRQQQAPNGSGAAPPVPPHRSTPTSPSPSPTEEAEAFKAAGNKYFKEKKYADAIKQYDKGKSGLIFLCTVRGGCPLPFPFPHLLQLNL